MNHYCGFCDEPIGADRRCTCPEFERLRGELVAAGWTFDQPVPPPPDHLPGWASLAQQRCAHELTLGRLRALPESLRAAHKTWTGPKGHPSPLPLHEWKHWNAFVESLVAVARAAGKPPAA